MPYILKERRKEIDEDLVHLLFNLQEYEFNEGDMNYVMSVICKHALRQHGCCYANLNMIVGVLESAKAEFIRREMAPYEDGKIELNGDIEFVDYDSAALIEVEEE